MKTKYFEAGGPSGENAPAPAPAPKDAPAPVYSTYGIGAPSTASPYTQQQINDALRAELAARPGTTYADMMRFAGQTYGLAPAQVQAAYDSIQGSVTPYNAPPPEGGIYSAIPAVYQPVRYTPSYDQFGQGIASLFGRGYSQYFQPPGLTGTYFFGTRGAGGVPTYVPPGGPNVPGGPTTPITPIKPTTPVTPIKPTQPPVARPPGLTDTQFEQYVSLPADQRSLYEKAAGAFNAPGNVQSDAAGMRDFMRTNNLSVADMARLTGATEQQVRSYLGQAGLSDAQLGRYQNIGATDQARYAALSGIFNAPTSVQTDASNMLSYMRANNLSAADVAKITGVSEQQIQSYLGQGMGLRDEQLARYQQLNPSDQSSYAALSQALNRDRFSPTLNTVFGTNLPTNEVSTFMQQNNLSAADVSRITGIPTDAVNAYLAQSAAPEPSAQTLQPVAPPPPVMAAPAPAQPEGYNSAVYNYVAANINDPVAVYNRMNEVGTNTAGLATALGIPESQVVQYFTDAGLMGRESP